MLTVSVEYQAPETISDPLGLSNSIQRRIEDHLRDANDITGAEGNVRLCVNRCEIRPNFGRVQMQLSGTLNGRSFDHTLLAKDEPRRIPGRPTDRLILSGFVNLGTWLARLITPSDLAVCLGNRRVCGRTLRAMEDCLGDARVCLDRALGRPASNGTATWNAAKRNSLYAALGSLLVVAAIYLFRRGQFRVVQGLQRLARIGLNISFRLRVSECRRNSRCQCSSCDYSEFETFHFVTPVDSLRSLLSLNIKFVKIREIVICASFIHSTITNFRLTRR